MFFKNNIMIPQEEVSVKHFLQKIGEKLQKVSSRKIHLFLLDIKCTLSCILIPNAAKQVSRTLPSFALQNSIWYDKSIIKNKTAKKAA